MFQIDVMSRTPLYEQIIQQIESYILAGLLGINEQLPSVRSLSMELSINPNTIQKAYSELDRRGVIYSVPGKGCFVSETALQLLSEMKKARIDELYPLLTELAQAGIPKEEIIRYVETVYDTKGERR